MRRYLIYLLIIVSLVSYLNIICFADSPNTESIRQELNQEMEEVYGIPDYYPAEVGGRSLNIYTRDQAIDGGQSILTYIPAYGSPSGTEYRNIKKYIGYTRNGVNDPVSNPDYGWREGWSGRRMCVWGQIEAPWMHGACVKSRFDDKTFNIPGKGITSLEDAMQVGIDLRYAGKKYEEIRFSERSMQHVDKIVHIKGEKPAGGWVKYVHVVIPPTRKAWEAGCMYLSNGNYMGIPIAPFDLISPDQSAHLSPGTFSPVKNGDRVSLSATVKSNFEDSQETYYEWEIVGEKTGTQYHLQSNEGKADEEKTKFGGYGEVDKSRGNVTVSQYINEHSPSPPAVLNYEEKTKRLEEQILNISKTNQVSIQSLRHVFEIYKTQGNTSGMDATMREIQRIQQECGRNKEEYIFNSKDKTTKVSIDKAITFTTTDIIGLHQRDSAIITMRGLIPGAGMVLGPLVAAIVEEEQNGSISPTNTAKNIAISALGINHPKKAIGAGLLDGGASTALEDRDIYVAKGIELKEEDTHIMVRCVSNPGLTVGVTEMYVRDGRMIMYEEYGIFDMPESRDYDPRTAHQFDNILVRKWKKAGYK